jgi:putative nucleotidyltransferase with HDIG domain
MTIKKRVEVADLKIGMFVAELDRPWLESPFLFQGFTIKDEKDLKQLRETCRYVLIDVEKGDDAPASPGRRAASGIAPGPTSRPRQDPPRVGFRQEIGRAVKARAKAGGFVSRVFHDVRLGESVNTGEAREVVSGLVKTVSANANASIWLTNLRRQHERTASHCMNVCVLALAFARHLGYDREELEAIGLGALLHDVGLMRTPREILDKPDTLTGEEFEVVKRHPMQGYNVMRLVRGLPAMALNVVRHHHERVNGKGYPEGLSGDDIPREALIVAIADVYDTVTSERPYGEPVPPHQALGMLRQAGPEEFGTDLVEQFMRCIGIYPVGSLVKFATGALGVVVSHTQRTRLRPVVMMLREADGSGYQRRPLVNLDALPDGVDASHWRIESIVNPDDHGIDLTEIAEAQSQGVG